MKEGAGLLPFQFLSATLLRKNVPHCLVFHCNSCCIFWLSADFAAFAKNLLILATLASVRFCL